MEFQEVFVWSYEDMPKIDPKIAQHHIDTHDHMVPIKQNLRRMRTEWLLKINEEVTKQLKVGFIKPIHQTEWIANILPIPKKDENVRMCVDFRDLNKACPKDDFPLPHIDVLVDNTARNVLTSFIDGFSGFLVSDRGIEVDPSKIKAILEMPPPKSEKNIRGSWVDYNTLVDSLPSSPPLMSPSSKS